MRRQRPHDPDDVGVRGVPPAVGAPHQGVDGAAPCATASTAVATWAATSFSGMVSDSPRQSRAQPAHEPHEPRRPSTSWASYSQPDSPAAR